MYYITEEILSRYKRKNLKTLKTKEDIRNAYYNIFAFRLADNPSDIFILRKEEVVNKVVNELYEVLNNENKKIIKYLTMKIKNIIINLSNERKRKKN